MVCGSAPCRLFQIRRLWKACHKPGSVLPVVRTGTTLPLLEATIIYLGRTLLPGSSDQPGRAPGQGLRHPPQRLHARVPLRSCSGWGLPGTKSPAFLVVSYTTVPPLPVILKVLEQLPKSIGGPFLWHYPSARADWTLSSILALWSPDFPPAASSPPAIVCQTSRKL